ncbi:hypothetical protein [Arenicella xantha]|uniref:Uncharacterized protein n=1 Tax=Arenicella xantha TaxID=644221 RepID=A0A395JPX2_9GAMM|nr:hypothetical protein [Arenicella xantha]RBP53710.1 hypothetical protein DFR28_1011099 [Arenicella xantha]
MAAKSMFFIWLLSFGLGVMSETFWDLPLIFSIILPAIFLSLSFYVFRNFVIGYRIFHIICITSLWLYFALGLLIQLPTILSKSGIAERLAYQWFQSLSLTYLFFLMMFGVAYLPYYIVKRVKARKPSGIEMM